jgi:hypothetical protein
VASCGSFSARSVSHSATLSSWTGHGLKRADRLAHLGQRRHDPPIDAHVRTSAFQHLARGYRVRGAHGDMERTHRPRRYAQATHLAHAPALPRGLRNVRSSPPFQTLRKASDPRSRAGDSARWPGRLNSTQPALWVARCRRARARRGRVVCARERVDTRDIHHAGRACDRPRRAPRTAASESPAVAA